MRSHEARCTINKIKASNFFFNISAENKDSAECKSVVYLNGDAVPEKRNVFSAHCENDLSELLT